MLKLTFKLFIWIKMNDMIYHIKKCLPWDGLSELMQMIFGWMLIKLILKVSLNMHFAEDEHMHNMLISLQSRVKLMQKDTKIYIIYSAYAIYIPRLWYTYHVLAFHTYQLWLCGSHDHHHEQAHLTHSLTWWIASWTVQHMFSMS